MNPGVFSVKYRQVIFFAVALAVVGGFAAYRKLGRLEDPEFTIKDALIITPYPGASAEEVAEEVSNPIERACQQLGQLDRVESESSRGMSIVTARIKDRYHKARIPQVWDELRRKINDVQPQLPPSCGAVRRLWTISATFTGFSSPLVVKAIHPRNCGATPSSCAASCCW